jgi:hypothetical protein
MFDCRRFIRGLILPIIVAVLSLVFVEAAGAMTAGQICKSDTDCNAGLQCADGRRCAPLNDTGKAGDYCHHDNHCVTGRCNCDHGQFGFCRDWEQWPAGTFGGGPGNVRIGFCTGLQPMGGPCRKNSECHALLVCADGQRCAPANGTGHEGHYCHHNDHCLPSLQCVCPPGQGQSFGFCQDWESYDFLTAQRMYKAKIGFFCR